MLHNGVQDFSNELARQKERILFLQSPTANIAMIVMAVLFSLILREHADIQKLMLWSGGVILFAAFRLLIWATHRRRPELRSTEGWIDSYTIATGLLGLVFANCYLFGYQNDDLIVWFTLTFTLFSMITAAGYVLSCHLPVFFVYTYPQVIAYGVVLLSFDTMTHLLLTIAVVIYLIMLTAFTRNANRQFVKTVRLQFENRNLIETLNHEVEERENMIRKRTSELVQTNLDLERKEKLLKRNERSLHFLAHHDTLTGLPNRLLLIDRLNQSIKRAERAATGLAVMFIDLDNFKEINDSLGHSVGDEVLQAVAETLKGSIRREDTAARLGGDEFTVILEDLEEDDYVASIAEKLLRNFERPMQLPQQELTITASIGISIYPEHGIDTETLLRNADTAMYRTKNEGRNGYRVYSEDLTERAVTRLVLETALRKAVPRDELVLHYQPQIDLANDKVVGMEALLRWMHPQQGLLYPNSFIALAEETGLIDEIGLWVIGEAIERLVAWQAEGLQGFRMAVNISGRQLQDEHLAQKIADLLAAHDCDPARLELEITEGYLIQQPDKTALRINDLRNIGVHIAIDDFGTGYSSLTHLKQFPISKLKVDASFIRDVLTDANDQAITQAIIALGKSLELKVIAEGVETEQQMQFLLDEYCDEAQGFLFARPMAEPELLAYLRSRL